MTHALMRSVVGALLLVSVEEEPDAGSLARVWEILRQEEPGAATQALVALGPESVEDIYRAWTGEGRHERPAGPGPGTTGSRDRHQRQAQAQSALTDALRQQSAGLHQVLTEVRAREHTLDETLHGLRVLGDVGRAQDLALWLQLLGDLDDHAQTSPTVRNTVRESLRNLLQREPRVGPGLVPSLPRVPAPFLPGFLEAMAESGQDVVQIMVRLVGDDVEKDLILLPALVDAVHPAFPDSRDRLVRAVQKALRHRDLPVRRVAARAAGSLRDPGTWDDILDLTDAEDPLLSRLARETCQALSGHRVQQSADDWRAWWEAEQEWLNRHERDLRQGLTGTDPLATVQAFRRLAARPLVTAHYAERVRGFLEHEHAVVRTEACQALASLRDRAALADLSDLLEDKDRRVRHGAWEALRVIAGLDLPPDRARWSAALFP